MHYRYSTQFDFINGGGKVVVCKVCLEFAGYDTTETINGTIIATPEITSKLTSIIRD
jgi:hypothetical protein